MVQHTQQKVFLMFIAKSYPSSPLVFYFKRRGMTTKERPRAGGKEEFRHISWIVVGMTAGTDNQFSCCFSVDDESSERNQNHSRNGNWKLSVEPSLILKWIEEDGSWFIWIVESSHSGGQGVEWGRTQKRQRCEWKEHMIVDGGLRTILGLLYSHHITLMTSSNLTLFIANAFQNHQLQAHPPRTIDSWI